MAERGSLTLISEAEYEAIEAAVMETARGRWFLSEFAVRNRTADTKMLLEAISRLENAITGERAAQSMDRVRFDLMEMAKAIARTKSEIAAINPADQEQSRLTEASETLDAIVRTTEQATSDILEAAEHVQEAAWTLRETGADEQLCSELDRRATEIYTACSFQDLTAQRTGKIVNTLRYLEGRINAMIDIWGGDEPAEAETHRPVQPTDRVLDSELSQSDVDTVIVNAELLSAPPEEESSGTALDHPPPVLIEHAEDVGFIEVPSEVEVPSPVEAPSVIEAPVASPAPLPEATAPKLAVTEAPVVAATPIPVLAEAPITIEAPPPKLVAPEAPVAVEAPRPVVAETPVAVELPPKPVTAEAPAALATPPLKPIDTEAPLAAAPPKPVAIEATTIIETSPLPAPPPEASRLEAFAEIEGLDTREKLRRFT